jgi:hypothetical protein
MSVDRCRDHINGLVEQVVHNIWSHSNRRAINLNAVNLDINSSTQDCYLTIYRYSLFGNHFLTSTATTPTMAS